MILVDVGGGSTEFAVGSVNDGYSVAVPADVGASNLTDAYLHGDPPPADELSAALSIVELHVDDVRRELPGLADALSSSGLIVGVGGTVTTIAAVEIGLTEYDRDTVDGFELTKQHGEDVFRTLATESAADRVSQSGPGSDRVDLIVGGACVVVEIMRQLELIDQSVDGGNPGRRGPDVKCPMTTLFGPRLSYVRWSWMTSSNGEKSVGATSNG